MLNTKPYGIVWCVEKTKTKFQEKIDLIKEQGLLEKLALDLDTSAAYLSGHLYRSSREPKLTVGFKLAKRLDMPVSDLVAHFNQV